MKASEDKLNVCISDQNLRRVMRKYFLRPKRCYLVLWLYRLGFVISAILSIWVGYTNKEQAYVGPLLFLVFYFCARYESMLIHLVAELREREISDLSSSSIPRGAEGGGGSEEGKP